MNQYQELYKKKQMSAEQALELIQDGDSMFSAQAAAEPQAILSKLQHLKETGVKGTTLNSCLPIQYYDAMKDPEMAGIMSHNGWFFTAGLRDAQKKKLVSTAPAGRGPPARGAGHGLPHGLPRLLFPLGQRNL